ncbi:MAG TPA: NAD-dependent epimerase/dehydratase family protein [Acidimicrobiales bacterium]|jgi:UDP-glucose 4-epimerase|nr:NAD-dependent epimerase/dehydratase family protein [Acidimicrobiales bacterium]
MPNTYLVTGGAGFIGSHTVEALLARGDSVIAVDNLSTGSRVNLAAVEHHPRLRFVAGSVLDEPLVDELVNQSDVVIHLAASVGVKLIIEQPLRSFLNNVRGSEVVIGAAHRYRRTILVASTSEVYGKNGSRPLREDDDRLLGATSVSRWAYSTAKSVDEIMAFSYHRERGLPAIVTRLFNTVGPRQSPAYGMVIPRLVRQAVAGEPLTVYGDGLQTRCFCHVSDVVTALLLLLEEPLAVGEAFNVGAPEEVSILDLAQRIRAATGNRSPVVLVPYDEAYDPGFEDMRRRVPDISKLRGLTGWSPTRPLSAILDEVIAEAQGEPMASIAWT